jgi:hydroxyethylthiazole kinase-like uncharacterized protein yjeF
VKIVTAAQMAAIEQASARAGVSTDVLMENAGLAVASVARDRMGGAAAKRVVVLVGPGNNGSDGLVAGRHLARWGAEITAYVAAGRPEADAKMQSALHYGVSVVRAVDDPGLGALGRLIDRSELVIDAVLGTGRSRPLAGTVRDVMLRLREARDSSDILGKTLGRPAVLALDLPTGLNADSGQADPACPFVDCTLALGFPKAGMLRFPGAAHVGRLQVLDIGLPPGLSEEQEVGLELLTPEWVSARLPERPLDSHKGSYGHALVVAGSRNYAGAAYLSSQASVRTGAGLTTLASPVGVHPIAASRNAEAIHLPLPEDADGRTSPEAALVVRESARRYSALAVGCGLGWSAGTTAFVERLLCEAAPALPTLPTVPILPVLPVLPVLIDADGLNNLSQVADWPRRVTRPLVLTPHPGEMSTLTGLTVAQIQTDRETVARKWAEQWGACVVLKGAHTVIAAPGQPVAVAPFANPGLATGGTGDVLSGVIVSLLAQGLGPYDAACCGVYLHGMAALSVTSWLGNAGLAASDLLGALPEAMRRLRDGR